MNVETLWRIPKKSQTELRSSPLHSYRRTKSDQSFSTCSGVSFE